MDASGHVFGLALMPRPREQVGGARAAPLADLHLVLTRGLRLGRIGELRSHPELDRAPDAGEQRLELLSALVEDALQRLLVGDRSVDSQGKDGGALHQLLDDPLVRP